MAADTGSGRNAQTAQGAVIATGANRTPRQLRTVKRRQRMVMLIIGLDLLRDRHVQEQILVGVITLVVLARLARQSEARAQAGLIGWLNAGPAARPNPS